VKERRVNSREEKPSHTAEPPKRGEGGGLQKLRDKSCNRLKQFKTDCFSIKSYCFNLF